MYQIDMKFDRHLRAATETSLVVKHFQDGGRPPFWKSLYRHISAKNHPILVTFCTQQQILNWMNVTWSKMKKLHWTDSEFDRTYFLSLIFSVLLPLWTDIYPPAVSVLYMVAMPWTVSCLFTTTTFLHFYFFLHLQIPVLRPDSIPLDLWPRSCSRR